jgi:hypothetical protein
MHASRPVRGLLLVWPGWIAVLLSHQALVGARFQAQRPDTVLAWTAADTDTHSLDDRPYLSEPFLNHQVAWDSEWYLSIATVGYDDPLVRTIYLDPSESPRPYVTKNVSPPPIAVPARVGGWPPWIPRHYRAYSLNYAFFPFYPLALRAVRLPLLTLGLSPIATSALGEAGAQRSAFFLIAFPPGFFLAPAALFTFKFWVS